MTSSIYVNDGCIIEELPRIIDFIVNSRNRPNDRDTALFLFHAWTFASIRYFLLFIKYTIESLNLNLKWENNAKIKKRKYIIKNQLLGPEGY